MIFRFSTFCIDIVVTTLVVIVLAWLIATRKKKDENQKIDDLSILVNVDLVL